MRTDCRDIWIFYRGIVSRYSVDLVLFIYCLSTFVFGTGSSNLLLQKTCFPYGPPNITAICTDPEKLKEISNMNTVRSSLKDCLPGLVVLLAGSWRDHTGLSRPLVLISHVGEIISGGVNLVSAFNWELSPWTVLILESCSSAIFGGRALTTIACLTYITERSEGESRSARLAVVMVAMLGGICIATAAGGYILNGIGYQLLFFICLIIYGLNMILAFFAIKDKPRRNQTGGPLESLKRFKVIFERRPNRTIVWIFILASCIISALLNSEGIVSPLFFQNVLHIPVTDIGLLGAYRLLVALITAGVLTPILKSVFKMSDFTLAIICTIPSAISCFCMAFAKTLVEVYIYHTLDMMRIVYLSTLTALITRCVRTTDLGIYTSFLSFGEALSPLALNPIYSYIFQHTMDTLPGAIFIVSGCTMCVSCMLIIISRCFDLKLTEEDEPALPSAEDESC